MTDFDDIAGTLDFFKGDLHSDLAPYVDGSILHNEFEIITLPDDVGPFSSGN
ncbi:hypothetical protein HFO56_24195 [Rhizobium laguerreae]|uniref:hypothetical protein n=1 Tax=Rhizobium laguerreae TaxID=1076926 RepID=UPI001C8FC7F6|nr:hypothetical protein [Rhizobium laguerreae]MBY3155431.1 hypothetical protein [Rhizobium laguerreae]